ncbi:methyltransferase domain-containing protein [Vibrio profundum]|uniref:class I SAM-dependent methyltransferase n=1 Tax=Vibrio profundum TaxID=2910247 RepID=UPI003D126147
MNKNNLFRDAEHYHNNAIIQHELSVKVIHSIDINNPEKILDIGSGDGTVTQYLNEHFQGHVSGIDISLPMLEFATDRWKENVDVSFQHGDAISFRSVTKFDLITSFNCLHWVSPIEQALNNIHSLLSNNGTFIGLVYPRCESIWLPAESLESHPKWCKHFADFTNPYQFLTADDYRIQLHQAGFSSIKVEQNTYQKQFNSSTQFLHYIQSWLPHCNHLDPSLRNEFIHDWHLLFSEMNPFGPKVLEYDSITFACHR